MDPQQVILKALIASGHSEEEAKKLLQKRFINKPQGNPNALRPAGQPAFQANQHPRYPVGHPLAGQFMPNPSAPSGSTAEPKYGDRVIATGVLKYSNTKDALLLTGIKINGKPFSRDHLNLRMQDMKNASIGDGVGPGKHVVIKGTFNKYNSNGQWKDALTDVTSIRGIQ